jgi:DNA repair protein RadD
MQLRDYQQFAVDSVWRYFSEHDGNPLIAMPTGTGKSLVIAGLLRSMFAAYPKTRVLKATHVKELISQNFEKLVKLWPAAAGLTGVYSAGLGRRDTFQPIIFAGIASIAKKAHEFGFVDLLLIDEAHLVSPEKATMYRQLIEGLRKINPKLKVVGLTATPWRMGSGMLVESGLFTDVCVDMTTMEAFNWFIAEGYLCPLIPKNPKTILDTSGVHVQSGEFKQNELQLAVDKEAITEAALNEMLEYGADRKSWLIFASGVDHSIHIAEKLTSMGVPCEAVHTRTSDEDRERTMANWKSGRLRAVANNNVLTTGVDHPALDLIGVLRPTMSSQLWVQMLGRGTRPDYAPGFDLWSTQGRLDAIAASEKRNCLVLDFAGNTQKLGPINDPVMPRKKGDPVGGPAPAKLCMSCGCWNHARVTHCQFCGAEFIMLVKLNQEASTTALIKESASPIVEVFKVDTSTVDVHHKQGSPPMLKVTYYCGFRNFREFIGFEHQGFMRRKALSWWQQRSKSIPPMTTAQALEGSPSLRVPTHLRVWINKDGGKYPEILATCFDGTAFGTQAPPDPDLTPATARAFAADDDIVPF